MFPCFASALAFVLAVAGLAPFVEVSAAVAGASLSPWAPLSLRLQPALTRLETNTPATRVLATRVLATKVLATKVLATKVLATNSPTIGARSKTFMASPSAVVGSTVATPHYSRKGCPLSWRRGLGGRGRTPCG